MQNGDTIRLDIAGDHFLLWNIFQETFRLPACHSMGFEERPQAPFTSLHR